jgi:pSer/pThr/pTyr-binding forkhead associated (FHA) protein
VTVARIELPGGEHYSLDEGGIRIGRTASNEVVIPDDPKVSRSHAEIRLHDGQWTVLDLGSRNGTKVNGRTVESHPLRDGDRIRLGSTSVLFVAENDPNATEAATGNLPAAPDLSERERQVLGLIAQGLKDKEIGEQLFISASTVRSHLDRIGEKTGLRRRAELTRLAIELGVDQ